MVLGLYVMMKFTKKELMLACIALICAGLFIGLALAHNQTIDDLRACGEKLKEKRALQCGPKLVNAPGTDINFSAWGLKNAKPD